MTLPVMHFIQCTIIYKIHRVLHDFMYMKESIKYYSICIIIGFTNLCYYYYFMKDITLH